MARFLDHSISWRRSDGGRASSRACRILPHASGTSRASRRGKAARAVARPWPGSAMALDLTSMRIARRSRVPAMACAVVLAGSWVTMKLSMACSNSPGERLRVSRQYPKESASTSLSLSGHGSQSDRSGMLRAATART